MWGHHSIVRTMPEVDEEAGLDLRDYLRILRKNWLLVMVSTALGAISAVTISLAATPEYEASTSMYVSVRSAQATTGDLNQGSTYARQAVLSYVDVTRSAVVLSRVIDDMDLDETPKELAESISANSPTNSVLVNVTVTREDPEQAAAIGNSIGENFVYVVTNVLEKPEIGQPSTVQIETIEPAAVPEEPSSPNTTLNVALGLMLGLLVGLGAAVLRSALDTRVRRVEDITKLTELPVLASIVDDPSAIKRPLIVDLDPNAARSESFRGLRTAMQFVSVDHHPNTFLVTSASPGEGKTTVSTNLAIAFAQVGASVVLIDGDLRKPTIARFMGLEGAVGLSNVLAGLVDVNEVLQKWGRTNLFILPAGRVPPNPSELLGSAKMRDTLAALTTQFDYVIIDSPPVLSVTDAVVVSSLAGGTIMVAALGIVRKHDLSAALGVLDGGAQRVVGVVMTHVPITGPDASGYARYAYERAKVAPMGGSRHAKVYGGDADDERAIKDPPGWLDGEPDDIQRRHDR